MTVSRFFLSMAIVVSAPVLCKFVVVNAVAVEPLPQAHAHNDYLHARPLLDALDHGFNSVEADIYLVDGKLLVAHTARELKPERTLESLYLEPLRQRAKEQAGRVFRDGEAFHLLIDIKSESESTYAVLDKLLMEYSDIISVVRDGHRDSKAVNVVISGNRPIATLEKQAIRYAGLDGRFGDLDSEASPELVPLISDNWTVHFKWRGQGPFSDVERQKLDDAVAKAHLHGRKIRFWATPDNKPMWEALRASGVDMINTDDLTGLEQFLRHASASKRSN